MQETEREALVKVIYQTPTPAGVTHGSEWPFPVTVTEVADAILAAGFRRLSESETHRDELITGWADWFEHNDSYVGGKRVFTAGEVAALLHGRPPFGITDAGVDVTGI